MSLVVCCEMYFLCLHFSGCAGCLVVFFSAASSALLSVFLGLVQLFCRFSPSSSFSRTC